MPKLLPVSVMVVEAEAVVPFPSIMPFTLVWMVIAGVEVGLATVPANPLAEATDTEVTVPVPATACQVVSPELSVAVRTRPFDGLPPVIVNPPARMVPLISNG